MYQKGKTMGFRKVKGKKYNSIYEYYKDSDNDKKTIAFYILYRDLDNNPKKVKCNATSKDEALRILNDKKAELARDRADIKQDASLLHQKVMNNNLALEDLANFSILPKLPYLTK